MPKRKKFFSSKKERATDPALSSDNPVAKRRAIEAQFRRMQEKRARKARLDVEKKSRLSQLRQEREEEINHVRQAEEKRRREGAARRARLQEEIAKRKEEEEERKQKMEEAVFQGRELELEEVPLPEPIAPGVSEIDQPLEPIRPKQKIQPQEEERVEEKEEGGDLTADVVARNREQQMDKQAKVAIIKTGNERPRGTRKRRGKKRARAANKKIKKPKQQISLSQVQRELKRIYNNYQEKQAAKHSQQNKEALLRAREKIDPRYAAREKKRDPRIEKIRSALFRDRETPLGRSWREWRAKRLKANLEDVVGLDIGAASLRAVYPNKNGQVLLAERVLPEGLIVAGILQDIDELSHEIKGLWREAGISSKKVNFSLASELLAVRTVFLPSGDDQDIASALTLNADAIIAPMRAEESVVDYKTLLRSGPDVALQVAAADKTVTENYLEAVRSAGLLPISCQAGPLAASRTVVIPRSPASSHALIDIGAETTKILACSGPDSFYLRVIPIAGNHFTRAIMKEMDVSWEEAEQLKFTSSLEEGDSNSTLLKAQRPIADRLAQEILQTKERYSLSEIGEKRPLENCLFLGGGSLLPGLREQIRFFAGFKEILDLRPTTDIQDPETLGFFAPAIGLALGSDTSLLPEKGSGFWRPSITARVSASGKQGKRIVTREKRRVSPVLLSLLLSVLVFTGAMLWKNSLDSDSQALREQIALEDKIVANEQAKTTLSWSDLLSWVKEEGVRVIAAKDLPGAQEITVSWEGSLQALRLGLTKKNLVIQEIRVLSSGDPQKVKVVITNE